jgi:hypothetical protein
LKPVPSRVVILLLTTVMRTPGSSAARRLHLVMWLPGNRDVSPGLVTITVLATMDLLLGRSVAVTLVATAAAVVVVVVAMNPVVATVDTVDKVTLDMLLPELRQALLPGNSRLPPVVNLDTDMEVTVMLPLAWPLLLRRPAWLLGPTELLLLALLALAALPLLLRLSMDLRHLLPATSLLHLLLRLKLFAFMQLVYRRQKSRGYLLSFISDTADGPGSFPRLSM